MIAPRSVFALLHARTDAVIGTIVHAAQRHAWLVIGVSLAAAFAIGTWTVRHITITTDTEQMLSAELPWRVAYAAYKQEFPYFSDTIAIVIDGATADLARDAAGRLSEALSGHDLVEEVFYPQHDRFLRRHQLLYLDVDELQSLASELSAAQPLLARLSAERTSRVLFDLLGEALRAEDAEAVHALVPAMHHIADAIAAFNTGDSIPMSWQALIAGASPRDELHREIIAVQPHLDYSALLPAEPAIELILRTAADLDLETGSGVSVRLTGGAALSYDELRSVIAGSQNAGIAATIMVLVCLLLGLRSPILVIATLTTLVVGLVFTAGFAVFSVGTLNMISIAFAVLYVGLGVDFAIHICLRYREMLVDHGADVAVNTATRHVGVSLIICALTTAIGFYAFIPTAYRGVAELGIIAGSGMFISLAVSIVLLPALLHVLPEPGSAVRVINVPGAIASFPQRHSRGILAVAAIVWIVSALAIPGTRFDHDPINLNDQNADSVVTFRELLSDNDNSPLAITAMAESHAAVQAYVSALEKIPAVSSVRTVDSFIPADQDEKLAIIDDLGFIFGDELSLAPLPPHDPAATAAAIDKLLVELAAVSALDTQTPLAIAAGKLEAALESFKSTLSGRSAAARGVIFERLEDKLLASFDGRIALLNASLTPAAISIDALPDNLRRRWIGQSGHYRIEAYPATDLSGLNEMERFVAAVRGVFADSATGTPVINLGASAAVKNAFIQAFFYAFVVITALLWIILRSVKEVAIVLSPLILAGLITSATSVVLSLPFNFANIIALPLLLGIGVDSALHILHRYKTALPADGNLLQTSTARAVLFSALTTTVSFGNLAASTHAGTASMGIMLTIGVGSTLICTLLILPAMLQQYLRKV